MKKKNKCKKIIYVTIIITILTMFIIKTNNYLTSANAKETIEQVKLKDSSILFLDLEDKKSNYEQVIEVFEE